MSDPPEPAIRTGRTGAALVAVGGAAFLVAAVMALAARGLAGDEEAAHYLIARYAPLNPALFLSEVGRPLVTLALCLPAQLGLLGARLASALAVGSTAYAVARVARRTGWIDPVTAALFLLIQPFYLAHAGTAMTEPWAAALIAWGLVAFAERRPTLLAVVGCLLPLARMEMVALWPLLAWVFWRARRPGLIAVLPLGLLLWNLGGALASGDPLYLLHLRPRLYPAREPLLYAKSFVWILGWGLFGPVVLGLTRAGAALAGAPRRGAPRAGRGATRERPTDEAAWRRRVLIVCALVVVGAFALYTYLAAWRPLTYGNLRYLAYGAPLFAVLAGAGVDALRRSRGPSLWIGLALAAAGALVLWGRPVHEGSDLLARRSWIPALVALGWMALAISPRRARAAAPVLVVALGLTSLGLHHAGTLHLRPNAEQAGVASAARLLDRSALGDRPLISAHPLLAFYLDRNPYDRVMCPPVTSDLARHAPTGTLWFWETHYTPRPDAPQEPASLRTDPRWTYLGGVAAGDSTWAGAFFLRTTGAGADGGAALVTGGLNPETWFAVADYVTAGAGYAARAAAADPGDAERWRILADRLAASGRRDEARAALARAETLAPGDPANLAIVASILMDEGRTAEAMEAARRALEARPQDAFLQYLYGRMLWDTGRAEEARPLILGSTDRLGDRWDTQLLAGAVRFDAGDLAGAARHYRAALALNPSLVSAHYRLAQFALREGNVALGESHLRAVIALRPADPQAYVLLGELLEREGRPDEAERVWAEGLARTKSDSTLTNRPGTGPR